MHAALRTRLAAGVLTLAAATGVLAVSLYQQAGASTAPAALPPTVNGVKVVKDIRGALARRHVTVPGTPVRAVVWNDARGRNLVVLSSASRKLKPSGTSAKLYADHFATRAGSTVRLRAVRDGLDCTEGDLTARFKTGSPAVADVDHDHVAEVTFAYLLGCSNDVSPSTFKLLVLEGGAKYIVRGQSWEDQAGPVQGDHRLAFGTPEPAWSKWPAPIAERAKAVYHHWTHLAPTA
jgi:hypothetical protein